MNKKILFLTRISFGWLFLYAGLSKITSDVGWSAAGYLTNAKTFPGLFEFFASPSILPFTNFINEWGQVAIGISLILGICTRVSAWAGAAMMILYYFPVLDFPYPDSHSFIIDSHILYALTLAYMAESKVDEYLSVKKFLKR